ncbi:MAG: hypothetical protein IPO60_18130 [Flavobacteriales bacterium]|nr:hypothetical protein [Flavobacteriales bacterium]
MLLTSPTAPVKEVRPSPSSGSLIALPTDLAGCSMVYFYGINLSVAVAVGFIALLAWRWKQR